MSVLSDEDRAIYEWQLDVPGLGERGQTILKNSTALVSRAGGLGSPLCFSLAAAGVGKLIVAHAGDLRLDDLNRQILMRSDGVGHAREESIQKTLAAFNPRIEVVVVPENVSEENAARLVSGADIAFGAAPLFEERFLLNRECVNKGIPLIDCAMFSLEGHVIPILPGKSPCLSCIFPETPPHWKRRFPVIGAVSALAANIGAMEGIKALTGLGEPQFGKMIHFDTATMNFQKIVLHRNPECPVCATSR